MLKLTVSESVAELARPLTTTPEVVGGAPSPALRISSAVCPTAMELAEKLPVIPDGKPDRESATDCEKPFTGVTDIVAEVC
jgi:hypothetical protein